MMQDTSRSRLEELRAKKRSSRLAELRANRDGVQNQEAEDFDLGGFLADSAMDFGDQLDTIGRFLAKGLSLGQFDKLSAGIQSALTDAGYDEQLRAEQERNKYLGDKNPALAVTAEIGGSLIGIGKLQKAGLTFNKLIPQIAEKANKLKKLLGYGGNVAAGAGDAAVISGLMAEGDGRDAFTAAETGSMWGAAFAALPGPAKIAFSKFAESRIGKPLMDKAGNWTPIHLIKGEHELLKQFFKTGIGGALGGGKLRGQEKKYLERLEAAEASILAKNKKYSATRSNRINVSERKQLAREDVNKNLVMDRFDKTTKGSLSEVEAATAAKVTQAELASGEKAIALHSKTLNAAAPKGYDITKTGQEGVKQLQKAYKKAYKDAWSPVSGFSDDALDALIKQASKTKRGMTAPSEITAMGNTITHLNNLKKSGGAKGVKTLDDKLRKTAYAAGQKGEGELRDGLLKLRKTLIGTVPKEAKKAIEAVNKKYPDYLVVKDAANKSITTGGVPEPQALVQAVQKVGRGEAAIGNAPMQKYAVAADTGRKSADAALQNVKDQGAKSASLVKATADAEKVTLARGLNKSKKEAANARKDRRTIYDANTKSRNDAASAPIKADKKAAEKNKIGQTPRLPMQVATSAIVGGTAALPFLGPTLATGAVSIPLGVTLAKSLSSKTGQKLAAGQHGSQVWAREAQKNYGDTLRKFDKNTSLMTGLGKLNEATGMITGVRPALAGSMGKTDPEEERAKRRRRRY